MSEAKSSREAALSTANLFTGFFQLGFVARDMDRALEHLGERYHVRHFRRQRSTDWMDAAHAWVGDVMLEVMVLSDGAPPLYDGYTPEGDAAVRLHHHGYLARDDAHWAAIERMIEESGLPVAMGGAVMEGHLLFKYVDTRPDLGIYSEYMHNKGPAARRYDDVPHN